MRRTTWTRWLPAAFLPALLLLASGCGDKIVSPATDQLTDQQEIDQIIGAEDADIFNAPFFAQVEGAVFGTGIDPGGFSWGDPGFSADNFDLWRRVIDRRSVTITHQPAEGGGVLITWQAVYAGKLLIVDVDPGDSSRIVTEKPIEGTFSRQAIFRRHEMTAMNQRRWPHRRWHLESVSLGLAESKPVQTVGIESVTITDLDSDFTHTYTDPKALLDVETELPFLTPGHHIAVEVRVTDPSVLVYLHHDFHRRPMDSPEEGVFTGEFMVPLRAARHQVVVDVLDDATLLDPDGAYDSVSWGLVYGVNPNDMHI